MASSVRPENVTNVDAAAKLHLIQSWPSAQLTVIAVLGLPGNGDVNPTTDSHTSWLWTLLRGDLKGDCNFWLLSWEPNGGTAAFEGAVKYLENEMPDGQRYIFLAHSLGGIIVKDMLARNANTRKKTIGILFFGTPHQELPDSLLAALDVKESVRKAYFKDVNERFYHVASHLHLVSFYETAIPSPGPHGPDQVIVTAQNATLNLPNEISIASRSNHKNLFKFTSANDEGYDMVAACINSMNYDTKQPQLKVPETTRPSGNSPQKPNVGMDSEADFQMFFYLLNNDGIVRAKEKSVTEFQARKPVASVLYPLDRKEIQCSWAHIPVNAPLWIHPCLQSIAREAGFDLEITSPQFWNSLERNYTALAPHSIFMLPSSHVASSDHRTRRTRWSQCAIYLPYLHWDTVKSFQKRATTLRKRPDSEPGSNPRNVEPGLDPNIGRSFHPRRSLDQYFYTTLRDTSARDIDQVVMKRSGGTTPEGDRKMIMVDQLWLWILDEDDHRDNDVTPAVLTSFTPRTREGITDRLQWTADLHQDINNEIGRAPSRYSRSFTLAELVVRRAVNIMLDVKEESLDFLEIFRQEIGKLADQQVEQYNTFQRDLFATPEQRTSPSRRRAKMKYILLAADMIDELNMLKDVFETQRDTLIAFGRESRRNGPEARANPNLSHFAAVLKDIAEGDVSEHLRQVERLMEGAKRVHQALLDLLDLQQKEANLQELHNSNEQVEITNKISRMTQKQATEAGRQAEEVAQQSVVILLFTFVTVIFTPLSFFTSYYGMNVVSFTGESGNQSLAYVWAVMGPASAGIIIVLFLVAYLVYRRAGRGGSD